MFLSVPTGSPSGGPFLFWRKILIAIFVYLLASCLFMGVIIDSLEEGERMSGITLLLAALLWPLDAVLMIWTMITTPSTDPEN